MFIIMCVSLYTSRIVLSTLGVEDYGLYNVVGGIIAMFGFLNGSMSNTTSRYIAFYLGRNDVKMLSDFFSMAFIIHLCIAIIILFLGETIGLWYFYNKLVIPHGRFDAALWLYQLSVASTIMNILYVPFNASIIAHEKMGTFAYISIFDSLLKLVIVFCLKWSPYDKLIFYSTLLFSVSVIDVLIYLVYCKIKFQEIKFRWFWDAVLFKEMFGFAGWSLLGNFSYLFYNQGINLLLNAFCGPAINAARGIAVQVDGVIKNFATNVQTALNPQIIKSYAENNLERMSSLVFASSRFCFYLLFFLSLPVLVETEYILGVWLGQYPNHTVSFIRITLINVILDSLVNPLFTANLACGKVKIYQIVISLISYGFMPLTYLAIKKTNLPESVFLCVLACTMIGIIARIYILKIQIGIPTLMYINKVIFPIIKVGLISSIIPLIIDSLMTDSFVAFLLVSVVCVCSVALTIYICGISKNERIIVNNIVIGKINRFKFL